MGKYDGSMSHMLSLATEYKRTSCIDTIRVIDHKHMISILLRQVTDIMTRTVRPMLPLPVSGGHIALYDIIVGYLI